MKGKNVVIKLVLVCVGVCLSADLASSVGPVAAEAPSAAPAWLLALPETSPAARFDHTMAYDSARGRVVLFGGDSDSGSFAETWEWDGTTWLNKTPAASPLRRQIAAMAYDSARERMTLFGGYDERTGVGTGTWEWDGTAWVDKKPPASPPERSYHSMAYDSARERVVLFGGVGDQNFGDTWEWDGSTWVERLPATSPSVRLGHAMAYDSDRGRVVLFGGFDNETNAYLGDTWEWDGTTWIERTPAIAGPTARLWQAMAYDSARRRVVLFGGFDATGNLGDTWEWDGSRWVQQSPVTSPSTRSGLSMAYDSARQRVVLFGGGNNGGTAFGDTWEYTGCPDSDGDGVCDEEDACPRSILSPSVVLSYGTGSEQRMCDSGVANPVLTSCAPGAEMSCIGGPGCTIADDIELCKSLTSDCKDWQRCVDHLTKGFEDPPLQTQKQRHAIQKCADTVCK